METLSYWLARLEPVIRAETEGEIIVVLCNRCGTEDDVVYAGTSAVFGIHGGEVEVYGILGRGERELLIVDTKQRPEAKLISEPNSTVSNRSHASTCPSQSGGSRSTNATNPAPRSPAIPSPELTVDEIISPMSVVDIGHFERGRQNEFDTIRALFKPGKEKPGEPKPGKASTGKSKEPINNPPHRAPQRPQISTSGKTQTANSAEGPPRKHTHGHRSSSKGKGKAKEVGMQDQQKTPKQMPTTRVEGQHAFIPVNLNSPTFIRPPSTKSRNASQTRMLDQQAATHHLAEATKRISRSSSIQQPLKSPPNSAASLPEAILNMPFPENGFGRRNIRLPPRPKSMIW